MQKNKVSIHNCAPGDVIAEDIINETGIILISKNTIMNPFIKDRLLDNRIGEVWLYQQDPAGSKYQAIEEKYDETVMGIKNILDTLNKGGSLDYEMMEGVSANIIEGMDEEGHIVKYLQQIKVRDDYTYTHSINVAFYAMLISKWLGYNQQEVKEVVQAALLHDLGKVKIPNEILNKNGKLTDEEYEVMKLHSGLGYDTLRNIGISDNIKRAVRQHHERIDGSGYPDHLRSEEIDRYAKIIAVSDVFDAMTQNRIYKKKASPFDAFMMFLTTGINSYDTKVLNTFLRNISGFYVGSKVMLSNGGVGEIVFVPPYDLTSPIVISEGEYVDLSREREVKIVQIL